MRTYHFTSFGCKVNRYDGQRSVEELERAGWIQAERPDAADLLVVNCCVVTSRSAGRCRRFIRSVARRNGAAPVLVTGCQTPEDSAAFRAIDPRVQVAEPGKGIDILRGFLEFSAADNPGVSGLKGRTRAYVKVQDGCDLSCAYCVIPSIRGPSRSRHPGDILAEVARLLAAGHKELVLCGIRLGGYGVRESGSGGVRLEELLARILERERGRFRIRLSSLNPAEVTPGLLEIMAGDARVARHLHLPLQSGDDDTLRRMRRPYSSAGLLRKMEQVRAALTEPAITTDFMVGFPGEDDAAFERSLAVLHETGAARVHVFPYSVRRGTEAERMEQVPDGVKTERAAVARREAAILKDKFDRPFLGRDAEVLIEGPEPPLYGLTSRYQRVEIEAAKETVAGGAVLQTNEFATVRLTGYERGVFTGRSHHEAQE
jgi:threonylcarbamoyladenosine tRNA methylthiotransferase MtaB